MDELGMRIRAARRAAKPRISQERLAAKLGVSTKTVARWEQGTADVSVVQLQQIAVEVSVPLGQLLPEAAESLEEAVA